MIQQTPYSSVTRLMDVLFKELKLPVSTGTKDDAIYTLCVTLMAVIDRLYRQASGKDLSIREIGEECKGIISDIVHCREEEDKPTGNEAIH